MNDKICTVEEAISEVKDGDSVAIHSWGLTGTPGYLLRALKDCGAKDLTLYCNNFLPGIAQLEEMGLANLTSLLPQLKKLVSPFIGGRAFRASSLAETADIFEGRVQRGELEVETSTHGVYIERFMAGAMGAGGIYSPIGINTIIEQGKEKRTIDGKEYILQKPIRPDIGLVKAYRADKLGNLVYRGSSRGSNPIVAMASKLTIVEVFDIVEPGELDPEIIVTPSIYVDRIVKIPEDDISSENRIKDTLQMIIGIRARATENTPQSSGSSQGGLVMKERMSEELVAMRAAKELKDGDYCNLGIGIPQLCASYVPETVKVQTENGALGYGALITMDNMEQWDLDMSDAGARSFATAPGMVFFDLLSSFTMIRSGRLTSILGGLQVAENGDLAIHSISEGEEYPQIGGSMDLAWGAKRVIVAMTHTSKEDKPKIVKKLGMPLSARQSVDLIITDLAVIEVLPGGLLLKEVAPGWTADEVQSLTEAKLKIADDLKEVEL